MNLRSFRQIQRSHQHGSFGALEFAFSYLEHLEDVNVVVVYGGDNHQYEFFVNDTNKTALYRKCVMRNNSKYIILDNFSILLIKKIYVYLIFHFYFLFSDRRSPLYRHDFCNRVTTIDATVRAVRAFYTRYGGYTLAIPLGKFFIISFSYDILNIG